MEKWEDFMILEPQKRISRQALKVWRITGTIKIAVGWAIASVVFLLVHFFHWPIWISIVIALLGIVSSYLTIFLFPFLRWKWWRYDVHQEEIELQQGFIVKARSLVPMVRVQHVDTVQGPIQKRYKLASVIVHTAATAHEIPALEEEEAEALRNYISKLARVADEDV